jgi:hypothetical protein
MPNLTAGQWMWITLAMLAVANLIQGNVIMFFSLLSVAAGTFAYTWKRSTGRGN